MFVLDDPAPPRCPKIWKLKPTRQDLSYDIRHSYLLRTLDLCTRWPRPTSRMGSKTWILKRTRQELSFNIRHAYLIIVLYLCTWWPPGPKNMKCNTYSSRHFTWYKTCLPYHNSEFCTWWPRPSPGPKLWNLKPNRQDLQLHRDYVTYVVTWLWRTCTTRWYRLVLLFQNPGFSTTFLPDLIKYQIIYFLNIIN